ncbi:MAG: hypothetical protein II720_04650 [Bacteroidales bacterium]|nr:hypothetical protein [Bacteroidales bacterium]
MKTAKYLLCILAVALFASCKKAPAGQPGTSDDPTPSTQSDDPATPSDEPVPETGLKPWDDGTPAVDPAKGVRGYIPYKKDGKTGKATLVSIDAIEVTVGADGYISSAGVCSFTDGEYVYEDGSVSFSLGSNGLVEKYKETASWEGVVNSKELVFSYDKDNRIVSVEATETCTLEGRSTPMSSIPVTATLVWEGGLLKEIAMTSSDFSSKRTFLYDGEYPNPLGIMPSPVISSIFKEGSKAFSAGNNLILDVLCLVGGLGVAPEEFPTSSSYILQGSQTPSDTGYYVEFDETTGAIPTKENTTDFEWK